ncbi:MAG: DUF3298 and DUF4163 domain-containing protein [Ignavibacteria bacterium]
MRHISIFIIVVFIVIGCGKQSDTMNKTTGSAKQDVKTSDSIVFESKIFKKTYKDCKETEEKCSYLKVSYPVFSGSSAAEINKIIDTYIADSIFTVEGSSNNKNPEGLAKTFFTDYENAMKDASPDFPLVYALDINCSVVYNKPTALSLSVEYYINTGGAHPNSYARYFVFNPKSGKLLKLTDLFSIGFEVKLNKLIDKKYRELKNLKETDRLDSEKGYLFDNFLKYNDNFMLTKEGINFFYNNYEIAPYAVGPTELKFTYKELGEILTPEYKQ